jgi:hypothetical protein
MNKYHNKKTTIDGILFDSKKEGNYYTKLKLMQNAGLIWNLELQKKYILQASFTFNGKKIREISYYADFVYEDKDGLHVVDTKGGNATKTDVYKLKKKLFIKKYGIDIEEI